MNEEKEFVPTEIDKTFVKQIVLKLVIGGTWGYQNLPLVFQKIDDETLAVVAGWPELAKPGAVDWEIKKTRIVLEACGLKFKDMRGDDKMVEPEKNNG